MARPYVLLSAAVSIDGYLDTRPGEDRLMLSNSADFDRVDSVRAGVDAILVGAGTLRADNPRLLVNSAQRRADRLASGQSEYPLKVTVTATGDLDPDWKFWHHGGGKLVLAADDAATNKARANLGDLATVHTVPPPRPYGRPLSMPLETCTTSSGSWWRAAALSTPNSFRRGWPTNCSS